MNIKYKFFFLNNIYLIIIKKINKINYFKTITGFYLNY